MAIVANVHVLYKCNTGDANVLIFQLLRLTPVFVGKSGELQKRTSRYELSSNYIIGLVNRDVNANSLMRHDLGKPDLMHVRKV